ncbi:MAG TPA: dynamin family protein [Candidatus Sericytochromatia bacterium]
MDTTLVGSEAVDLLSRLTGQKLSQRDLNPPVIFMAALVTVLLGVMLVDGTVTDEEKQGWQKTINRFIPSAGNARQLTQLLSKGIRQNQVYKKLNELQTLTAPLSESERLLLIGFGYEMSAADGDMDAREKKYLEAIANRLGINPRHLAVLEAGFTHQGTVETAALDEVQFLLAPARFQELDTIFVKAASDMMAALPTKPEDKGTQQQRVTSYQQLKEFQNSRQQLSNFCNEIFQIIQECSNRDFLPHTLIEEIEKVFQKLQSQRFRVAVVGEFSQGKSTLLNALLGEEIQPVREIPCSGTVTILRYGMQKRVVCRYQDGREEEIPFNQYQEKAAISEEAALGNLTNELAQSEIDEIVFEHPDLDLCSNGVEIIDSPGLNEHPERTAVTQKLLKDTDAAIFLTNASRSLTQGERDLLQDLKFQLNGGFQDKPADNLFVVGNFMDLVRTEKGRNQVQQRIERFVQGQNSIVAGENRIHFISAQSALNAIVNGIEDDWLKAFQDFTGSVDKFLALERGSLEINQAVTKIKILIQECFNGLHQAEDVLDGKLNLSEAEKQKILEQIGEASGRDVRIRNFADKLIEASIQQVAESWDKWVEGLGERIAAKSGDWISEYSPLWDKEKLLKDYANQFTHSLSTEIDEWWNRQVADTILKQNVTNLDQQIRYEIEAIRYNLQILDSQISTNLTEQFSLITLAKGIDKLGVSSVSQSAGNEEGGISLMGGIGAGGLTFGALALFTGLGLVPLLLAGGAAAAIGSFLFGGPDEDQLHIQAKQKVYDLGFQRFDESVEETFNKVIENIASIFYYRVELADEAIKQAISTYEYVLERQEKAHKETLEQRESDKEFIAQKHQELEQVQKNIKAIYPFLINSD